MHGGDAVPDPLGAELAHRRPHLLRPHGLPRVRDTVQPGGARRGEDLPVVRPAYAGLGAAEPDQVHVQVHLRQSHQLGVGQREGVDTPTDHETVGGPAVTGAFKGERTQGWPPDRKHP